MTKRSGLKGCGQLWGCVGVCRALGSRSWGRWGHQVLALATSPSPWADPPCLNAPERKNNGADGGLDGLLMEIPLPLLLFAACGNCAEPQRWEPGRVSCVIPPASLHRRAVRSVRTPSCKQKLSPSCCWPGPGVGDVPTPGWEAPGVRSPAAGAAGRGLTHACPRGSQYNAMNCINAWQPRARRSGTLVSYGK